MELLTISDKLTKAKCPEDVFGSVSDERAMISVYRQLVLVIHPDKWQDDPKNLALANTALERLTRLRGEAERKIKVGTYGKKHMAAPPIKPVFHPVTIEAKGKAYTLVEHLGDGDLCDLYLCTINGGTEKWVFKVARSGSDNDLVENELKVLSKVYPSKEPEEKFYRLLPRLVDSFVIRSPGSQRRVNVFPWYSEYRSLEEVLTVYPEGVDFRDMIWMFKRILHAVGYVHVAHKHVHGAVLPAHVLIHPVNHGARLLDWSYSTPMTDPPKAVRYNPRATVVRPYIKAISAKYKDYYPKEVFEKEAPTAATDIYMAAKCAVALVGGDVKKDKIPDSVPEALRQELLKCLGPASSRPQNAWDFHEHLDKVLLKAVGKRAYRPFPMPNR